MTIPNDELVGKNINYIYVVKRLKKRSKDRHVLYLCRCACGNEIKIEATRLRKDNVKSCGCMTSELRAEGGRQNKIHGLSLTKVYSIYNQMIYRCINMNHDSYKDYGGRGIKVCDEWLDKENGFLNFYNWSIENDYKEGLSIDRINVNGNYEPSNCRWATMKEQQNNKRDNNKILYNNKEYTISELSELLGVKYSTISNRVHRGWSIDDIVRHKFEELTVEINGEDLTLNDISKRYDLTLGCVRSRYARGKRGSDLIKNKSKRGGKRG